MYSNLLCFFCSENAIDRIEKFRVDDRVDSDHLLITLKIEERGRGRTYVEGKDKEEEEEIWKICWDEESVQMYKENVEKLTWEKDSQGTIEEKLDKLKDMVQVAMIRKKVAKRKIELGQKDWWDKQCSKKKREVRRCYKKWRKGKIGKEKYMEERRKLKELAERKQREKREGEEKELKNLRNPTEVWRFINRKRKKRTWKEAEISKEVWRSYFMELLEGNETQKGRVNREEEGKIISIREKRIGQLEEEDRTVGRRGNW